MLNMTPSSVVHRLPGSGFQSTPLSGSNDSILCGMSDGFCIRMDPSYTWIASYDLCREPSFIGEVVEFAVSVQNHTPTPIQITSIDVKPAFVH